MVGDEGYIFSRGRIEKESSENASTAGISDGRVYSRSEHDQQWFSTFLMCGSFIHFFMLW